MEEQETKNNPFTNHGINFKKSGNFQFCNPSVISKHIKNVFDEKELKEKRNVQILHTPNSLDDERLKKGGGRYFHQLLQRIRYIQSLQSTKSAKHCVAN